MPEKELKSTYSPADPWEIPTSPKPNLRTIQVQEQPTGLVSTMC